MKLIETYHVIEHLNRHDLPIALKEWRRVLIVGGRLIIECPDFDEAIKEYIQGNEKRINNIFGLQRFPGDVHQFGYNLKITDMQAAIGLAQLEKLPRFIEARKKNHKRIFEGLKHLEDKIILPRAQKISDPSWFGFLITLKEGNTLTRTEIMQKLEEKQIQSRLLFGGNLTRQPVFNEMRESNSSFRIIDELTNTDKVMHNSFWIGVYPGMTSEMISYMIEVLCTILS